MKSLLIILSVAILNCGVGTINQEIDVDCGVAVEKLYSTGGFTELPFGNLGQVDAQKVCVQAMDRLYGGTCDNVVVEYYGCLTACEHYQDCATEKIVLDECRS